jgi:hypothetical protein
LLCRKLHRADSAAYDKVANWAHFAYYLMVPALCYAVRVCALKHPTTR